MLRTLSVLLLGAWAQPHQAGRYDHECVEPWKLAEAGRHTVETLTWAEKHVTRTLLHLEGKMPHLAADMTKVLEVLEKAEEHVQSTMEGFQDPRNADTCVTCPEVHRFIAHMTKHFLKFLDVDGSTKLDQIRPWKMEMIGLIGRIRSFAFKLCGPMHEHSALLGATLQDDTCLAQDAVTKAVDDVETALKTGIADLQSLDMTGVLGDIVDKAVGILNMGEQFVETEGAKLEAMACPVCDKLSDMADGLKTKIEGLLDATDMIPSWAKMFIDKALDDVDAALKEQCATTWLLKLADTSCLAEDELTTAIMVTDGALKTAISKLDALPDTGILGTFKTIAVKAVSDAESALMDAAPELEDSACADCKKLEGIFDAVKAKVDGIFDDNQDVPNFVKEIVDTAFDVVDKAFQSQCADKPALFAALDDCMAETAVTSGINMADAALKKIVSDIQAIPLSGALEGLATKAAAAIQEADDKLMEAAPGIEADACPTCEKLQSIFDEAKAKLEAAMDDAGLPSFLTDLVEAGMNKIDGVFETQCPASHTELQLGDTDCPLEDDLKVAFTAAGDFRQGLLKAVQDLEDIPKLKQMATMGYGILSTLDADITKMEDEILGEACPACDAIKTKFEAVKAKVTGFLDMFDNTDKHPVKDAIEGLLDMMDNVFSQLCDTTHVKLEADCMLQGDLSIGFSAAGELAKGALNALEKLENIDQLKEIATMAHMVISGIVSDVEKVEGEIIASACPTCQAVQVKFDAMKDKLDSFLDMFDKGARHPVKDAVEGLLDTIDNVFDMVCNQQ